MNQTDVLIVGAGPTGLALACDLARRGVRIRVIDKAAEYFTGSRGKAISPRTMEVLDGLGVADQVLAAGLLNVPMRTYDGGRVIGETIINPALYSGPEIPYPIPVLIPQYRTESILRDQLARQGVRVELHHEVIAVKQGEGDVTVKVAHHGCTEDVRAEYVVGCDGGHSTIRRLIGLSFGSAPNESEKWCWVGDVLIDGLEPGVAHRWNDPQRGMLLLSPFKDTELWQFQFLPADGTPPLPEPDQDEFRRVWAAWTGLPAERLHDTRTASRFRVNEHIADHYRVGRVFLAGDAAHIYSPAGGQGMTTGIQDAYNLGWKVAAVLAGAPSELLDTYEAERKPVAEYAMRRSRKRWKEVNQAVATQGDSPLWQLVSNEDTSQLNITYRGGPLAPADPEAATALRPGDRAPDGQLQDSSGRPTTLFAQFRTPEFRLLMFQGRQHPADAKTLAAMAQRVRASTDVPLRPIVITTDAATTHDANAVALNDPTQHTHDTYGVSTPGLYLIRPDGYIAYKCHTDQDGELVDYLKRHYCQTGQPSRPLPL
jgi:2-polyprenyl-6-methoxyphenol hydroxylase-like FAD-dependent oxidoreductase